MSLEWFHIEDAGWLDSPVMVVYPDRVAANIRLAIGMAGHPSRLRPHVKTHKSPELSRMLLEAGITKFKCATIAEAEMLALSGARDILLAYQPAGPKMHRFLTLTRQYPASKFSCLIDNESTAKEIGALFAAAHLDIAVYLDLDLGMHRTGIQPDARALQLYKRVAATDGITPVGLHAYDGHIRDSDPQLRKEKCDAAFAAVTDLKKAITADATLPAPIIVAGGSPTFPIHCTRLDVECSPGTFVYWDKGYADNFPDQGFLPAALVLTRIVSLPDKGLICLDLGHKSVSAENELGKRVFFLNAPHLKPISQSEEHLVVDAGANHSYQIGDLFYGQPIHICPAVALYERSYVIEKGRVTGEWKHSARDRKISV